MYASQDLYGSDIISDDAISARLDYLAFLDPSDMSEDDREFWADEIAELAELKALVAVVGAEHGGLISEHYWSNYAAADANETYDLEKTGANRYFDYASFENDLLTEFSSVEFHGTTYYYQ